MITCHICGGKRFAVYDACDQAMCLNCMAVTFNFSFIEKAHEIAQQKDGEVMCVGSVENALDVHWKDVEYDGITKIRKGQS